MEEQWSKYKYETLSCIVLLSGCQRALREHATLQFGWIYVEKPNDIDLTDGTASYFGFNRFSDCRVIEQGGAVDFELCSGAVFRVPVAYLLTWYDCEDVDCDVSIGDVVLHPDGDYGAVDLTLSDGREIMVSWDAVLMACEPAYEHYGGLTEGARRNIEEWAKRNGPFRISADA
jgi:hypothetical protein